jgi:signal transduction histidine kinase
MDTLQARLVASHALVIMLALGLVVASSAVFLRHYERSAEEERLAQLAVPLIAEVNIVRQGNGQTGSAKLRIDALDAQADAMDLRLLIVDVDGTVRYDTSEDENLKKQSLPEYAGVASAVVARAQTSNTLQYEFITPPRRDSFASRQVLIAAGQTGQWQATRALVILSDERRFPLLGVLLPRLFLVTGISLIVASIVGLALSRWISRPVQQLTLAANAMAAGHLEQEVPGAGPDEIGQLVGSFNSMSRQISSIYRSQRDLLANVAHELRTPLTSVQGYAKALSDGVIDQPAERERALAVIGNEAERMSNLIGQLLELARLESGQSKLSFEAIDVNSCVQRVADRFQPLATQRKVALVADAPGGLLICGDEKRLVQLLSNLVSNALRHTAEGGLVSINACSVDAQHDQPDRVRIIVHDTGSGIAADRIPRMFERFERDDTVDGEPQAGFGLGLAIVRELVDLHRGSIAVHSELGRGSTFTVDLLGADAATATTSPGIATSRPEVHPKGA